MNNIVDVAPLTSGGQATQGRDHKPSSKPKHWIHGQLGCNPDSISYDFMLSRGLTADIKSLSQRCKCKPNVLFKIVASYGTGDVGARGFTNTFMVSLA